MNSNLSGAIKISALAPTAESTVRLAAKNASGNPKRVYFAYKRMMDVVLSLAGLILLFPLFLVVAAVIRRDSKGAAVYTQTRIGKNGKPFTMYKFRSMCLGADAMLPALQRLNERDGPVFKIQKDPRVTKVGAVLRAVCIDELPQLVNILRGDMSLVGPRPPLPGEVEQYTRHQAGRLAIKPGLTCSWQVCDRTAASFADWVEMDLRYIRECSLWLDLKILFQTVCVVCGKSGAN